MAWPERLGDLELIAEMDSLTSLALFMNARGPDLKADDLRPITRLKNLESLLFGYSDMDRDVFELMQEFPNLRFLYCSSISDPGSLEAVVRNKSITALYLKSVPDQYADKFCEILSKPEQLERLGFQSGQRTVP